MAPPKKRKAARNPSAQPARKVRIGDTSTIDSDSRTGTPAGRPKRSTSNDEPQYNFTRVRRASAVADDNDKQNSTKPTTSTGTSEAKPRGRGRPRKRSATPEAQAPASPSATKGILNNGSTHAKKSQVTTANRLNIKAQGASTASTAKRRSSSSAHAASPTAEQKPTILTKKKRKRPAKKTIVAAEPESKEKPKPKPVVDLTSTPNEDDEEDEEVQYWLMKAEPDSRVEKGHDVKFSIDDLAARTEPEGWDGVRNPAARNNMRAIRVGDLAFFYHSNCKVPGVAGIMRIVEEHSVDESAFDPEHPYYDPKSDRNNPKWELVKVGFVKKVNTFVTLREMKSFAQDGGKLANMQMLRQGRLSVSSVKPKEWRFILDLADEEHDLGQLVKDNGHEGDINEETEALANGAKTDTE